MSGAAAQGLYTIPAGTPFLDALARGLLAQLGEDPAALGRARIFLPTRRACLAMADAFLRVSDGRPLLLPKLEPLGDVEPEDWHADAFSAAGAVAGLPPAIAPARRQLLLARLILARDPKLSPDQALKLAEALGLWLDQVQIHDRDPVELAGLVPSEYAAHWGKTLEFLELLTANWPAILAEEGAMDAVERRKAVIDAQIAAWKAAPPETPVIAAGSTGSLPATARLMRAILDLPAGAVVLPGLDTGLDDAAWDCLPEGHPQFGLANLLRALEQPRAAVQTWPDNAGPGPHTARTRARRARLLRHALRPADAPPAPEPLPAGRTGLESLMQVAAPGSEAEARVIALALRQFLERSGGGQTAALVTADRGLARRVAAELARWRIAIDDSAGEALLETGPGIYLHLVAEAACGGLAPVPLLALLKHPLAAVDRPAVQRLERAALRGLRPAPGIDGLRAALAEKPGEAQALTPLVDRLATALAPLSGLADQPGAPLADWLTAHVQAAEALAATEDETGADRLWADEAGEAAALGFDGLLAAAAAADFVTVTAADYQAVFEGLLGSQTVRPRYGKHPRLAILGPLEARLHCPQLAILGGLNEGSWPPEPERDPWMGRHMRQDFGLPLPEWRIGLAAHDFAQALAAPEVMLTRAERVGGAPTVPARWLARLELAAREATGALADETPNPLCDGSREWLAWADALERPTRTATPGPPEPTPPVAARFRDLSATHVDQWLRDPYGHYARHILRLRALEAVDEAPDAAERGTVLHAILRRFIDGVQGEWPADAYDRLVAIGEAEFGDLLTRPAVRAFWWRRFERMAGWFTKHEATRWPQLAETRTEATLAGDLSADEHTITVKARLDRLDRCAEGGFAIIDYKSGSLPSADSASPSYSPQLPLEGMLVLMAEANAELKSLEAWNVGGGSKDERGEAKDLTARLEPVQVAEAAWDGLGRLIRQFADPTMPYLAEPRPRLAPRYSDYRHLARIGQEEAPDA